MKDIVEISLFLTPEMLQSIEHYIISQKMPTAIKATSWLATLGDRFHEEYRQTCEWWDEWTRGGGPGGQDGKEAMEASAILQTFKGIYKESVMLKRWEGNEGVNVTLNKSDYEIFRSKADKNGEYLVAVVSLRVYVGLMFWEKYIECDKSQEPNASRAADCARASVIEPVKHDFKQRDISI